MPDAGTTPRPARRQSGCRPGRFQAFPGDPGGTRAQTRNGRADVLGAGRGARTAGETGVVPAARVTPSLAHCFLADTLAAATRPASKYTGSRMMAALDVIDVVIMSTLEPARARRRGADGPRIFRASRHFHARRGEDLRGAPRRRPVATATALRARGLGDGLDVFLCPFRKWRWGRKRGDENNAGTFPARALGPLEARARTRSISAMLFKASAPVRLEPQRGNTRLLPRGALFTKFEITVVVTTS